MHATAAMRCMERGKHVYVQKPLVRTIWEARMMLEAATKYKVATQMGNQGYSNEGTRQCAEMIWTGEIGNVTEVHAWTDRPIWPQGLTEIPATTPVPATLDWDLWLGIAEAAALTRRAAKAIRTRFGGNFYQPFNWRGFYDFGCGALGDMACHILGAPNMALQLGAPTSVECIKKEGASSFMFPKSVDHPVRFPGARQHAAGEGLLVRRPEGTAEDRRRSGRRICSAICRSVRRRPRTGSRSGGAAAAPAAAAADRPRRLRRGFVGQVFHWNDAYLSDAPSVARVRRTAACSSATRA